MKYRSVIIPLCTILLITTIAFFPSLENGFTNWDDDLYVTENPKIRQLSWKNVGRIFASTHYGGYEPLTELSFALEYRFFRLNPLPYHITNLLLHLLNCLLVFWLIILIGGNPQIAFVAALLFGVHPLRVESVAWVSELKDLLYGFFFLWSLIAYLLYLRKKRNGFYWFALFLFFLSLLPKPQGIFLPLVLLLLDYFTGRRFDRKALLEKIPFFLISTVFVIIAVAGKASVGYFDGERVSTGIPLILNGTYGLACYLVKLFIPAKLSSLYPYQEVTGFVVRKLYTYAPLIVVTLAVAVVYSARYGKKLVFAALFFLINLLLVLQFFSTGPAITADRYTYIPSIGIFYIIGCGLFRLSRAKIGRYLVPAALVIITVLFSILTRQRCLVWKDSLTLWNDVLKKYPGTAITHGNLGRALAEGGKLDEAILHYREAIRLRPDFAKAHYNLGLALDRRGRLQEAVRHYQAALKIKPDYPGAHLNLGVARAKQGKFDEAAYHYTKALKDNPDCVEAHYNLGVDLDAQGRFAEAIVHYREAIGIKPDYPEARLNLGVLLTGEGKLEEAAFHYRQALKSRPGYANAHVNLGVLLGEQGKFEEALFHYEEALRIKPGFPIALRKRKSLLEKMEERRRGVK